MAREKEHQKNKFAAALQGIDIDSNSASDDKFQEVQRRAEAKLSGKSIDELEFQDFGIDFQTE